MNSDRTEIQIIGQFVPLGNGVEVFLLLKRIYEDRVLLQSKLGICETIYQIF